MSWPLLSNQQTTNNTADRSNMDAAKVVKSNSEDFRLNPLSLGWIKAKQLDPKTFSSRRLVTLKTSPDRGCDDYFLSTRKSDHDYEYDDYDDYNYHGVSIPFRWESQPGTPKHNFHAHTTHQPLPPLTPPPSFFYTPTTPPSTPRINMNNKRRFLKPNYDLLRKIFRSPKRAHSNPPSPSSPASLSTSPSSSSSTHSTLRYPMSSSSSSRMMIYSDEKQRQPRTRTSTPRFFFESATSRRIANIRESQRDQTMYGHYFDDGDDNYEVSSLCFGKSPASYFAIFKSATMSIPNKKKTFNY